MELPKHADTAEVKELVVKRVKSGQSVRAVVKDFGRSDQALRNWMKAGAEGQRNGAGSKVVTPAEMELSRLRAENGRLKGGESLPASKKRRRTSRKLPCEGRLDCRARPVVCTVGEGVKGWMSASAAQKGLRQPRMTPGYRDGGPDYGLVPQAPGSRLDAPFRPQ